MLPIPVHTHHHAPLQISDAMSRRCSRAACKTLSAPVQRTREGIEGYLLFLLASLLCVWDLRQFWSVCWVEGRGGCGLQPCHASGSELQHLYAGCTVYVVHLDSTTSGANGSDIQVCIVIFLFGDARQLKTYELVRPKISHKRLSRSDFVSTSPNGVAFSHRTSSERMELALPKPTVTPHSPRFCFPEPARRDKAMESIPPLEIQISPCHGVDEKFLVISFSGLVQPV